MKRKIAECINVRINIGNYQHIELTKYAEEEIEFLDVKELVAKEDDLRNDLVSSLIRSMKYIPEKLGKGADKAIEVEESIKKAIPEWLEKNPVPNIANGAKKTDIRNSAEQMANKTIQEASVSNTLSVIEEPEKTEKTEKTEEKVTVDEKDLFEDDSNVSSTVAKEKSSADKTNSKGDDFDLFNDDDIFGDEN